MKTTTKAAICATICGTLFAGAVLAQRGSAPSEEGGPGGMRAALIRTLELDEEQQANIRAIFERNRETLRQAREAGKRVRMRMAGLMVRGTDEESLRKAWRRESAELEEMLVSVNETISEVRRELTPAQRETLEDIREFIMSSRAPNLDETP